MWNLMIDESGRPTKFFFLFWEIVPNVKCLRFLQICDVLQYLSCSSMEDSFKAPGRPPGASLHIYLNRKACRIT